MSVREDIKIMGASALMFRKGEYPTEKDLDIIIDIFTKMKFYSSGKDKEKLSKGECFSISFTNDHWRRRWDDDDYQWDSLDDNDHIIIYFFPKPKESHKYYIPSMGETVPSYIIFDDISGRERLLLEFFHTPLFFIRINQKVLGSSYIQVSFHGTFAYNLSISSFV